MRGKANCLVFIPVLLLGAFLFVRPLAAEAPEEVVNPRQAYGGFVSDGGGVLGPEYVGLIDGVCRDLQAKTGVEMAVVTVGDLGGLEIEEFAEKLFRRLGVGAAGKDNGLLLLCSRDDRSVRLEVGYGLESAIPDARASGLLDANAVPYLGKGEFGRGLFLAARAVASAAAASQGVTLAVEEPLPWPGQVAPPVPAAKAPAKKEGWDPLLSSLYFAGGIVAFALLASLWTLLRFRRARGRAARARIAGKMPASVVLSWIAAVISFVVIANLGGKFLPPFLAMLAAPSLATVGRLFAGRLLKRRLASYRLPCPQCGQGMEMVDDSRDDQNLSVEEQAEEKAGGMDYEFWQCPACGAAEKLAIKMGKAGKCPQCKRRSLRSVTATMAAATREQPGRVRVIESCLNPNCNYSHIREHSTPKLSPPSTSSPGSSRPSSGSFGGGRSGGGGASKHF
jgi:uncharacterized protein